MAHKAPKCPASICLCSSYISLHRGVDAGISSFSEVRLHFYGNGSFTGFYDGT